MSHFQRDSGLGDGFSRDIIVAFSSSMSPCTLCLCRVWFPCSGAVRYSHIAWQFYSKQHRMTSRNHKISHAHTHAHTYTLICTCGYCSVLLNQCLQLICDKLKLKHKRWRKTTTGNSLYTITAQNLNLFDNIQTRTGSNQRVRSEWVQWTTKMCISGSQHVCVTRCVWGCVGLCASMHV